ncbi:MAG: TonB-dependent receptor [Luminiphilus sp.]|nr:TonB-dependent receptor [Luminiphilus sp.]
MSHPTSQLSKLAIAVGTLAIALPAASQSVLEEIVVVAQKREQNLQEVPIAISAFTGAQMDALGVSESFDIATFAPGVHISGNLAGQNTQFSIRGVTQNDFNDIIEAPNAVYLDEGYIAVAQAQTFAVFDIDRVEILKGPQGTLFGRNATGGLVHFISNGPSFDETSGYLDVEVGQFDTANNANRYVVEGAVGGPLSDTFAARAAFRYSKQDPYLQNLYSNADQLPFLGDPGPGAGADLGDDDTLAARVRFAFQPTDNLRMDLSFNYSESEVATGPYQSKSTVGIAQDHDNNPDTPPELINVINTPSNESRLTILLDQNGNDTGLDGGADIEDGDEFLPGGGGGLPGRLAPGADFFGYLDPDGDDFTFSGDFAFADQGSTENSGINFKVSWDMSDSMTFTSITDYKDYEKLLFIDVDSAPVNQLANYAGVDASSFTQELRLNGETDRSRWVAGFYYLNIDSESDNGLKGPQGSFADVFGGVPIDVGTVAELETDSYSLFGQYEYDISDRLTVIAGLRGMREEKDFGLVLGVAPSESSFVVNTSPCFSGQLDQCFVGVSYEDDNSETLWAGKLQLTYDVSDDLMVYGGINRGVKAGSYNAPLLGAYFGSGGDAGLPYDSEELTSYEAGFKATLGGGTTRINGTAFYYDYTDYQAFLFVGVGGVVINKDADNYGVELEIQSSPMEGLDLILSGAYFDATVKDVSLRNGSPLPPSDVDPTYAPEFQATGLARYSFDALGGVVAVQGDISYSDEYYYNLRNFDADKFDSYTVVNAQISYANNGWLATLAARNITDERPGIQGFDLATLCGCNEVAYKAPRYYAFSVRKEF